MIEQPTPSDLDHEWGELAAPRQWWRSWSLWVMVGGCLVLGYGYLTPYLLRHGGHADLANVRRNAAQVVQALSAFKGEYGSYPNEGTITEVLKRHPEAKGLLGTVSSNDFFRQLIVAGCVDGERPFFMGHRSSQEVERDKTSGRMLGAGECAFSYVVREKDASIPQRAPLLMVPLVPGQLVFDLKLSDKKFSRQVIIGYSDGSVEIFQIDLKGKVRCGGGKDFFDPSLPHWGGRVPRIVWPE